MASFRALYSLGIVLNLLAVSCILIPNRSDKVKKAAEASNDFAFELQKLLLKEKEGQNIFFSPFSISTAFALTSLGAKGKTLHEICDVFHFGKVNKTEHENALHQAYHRLYHWFNSDKANYTLSTANRLFGDKSFNILESFQTNVKKYYHADLQQLDFHSGEAEGTINQWVEDQTEQKIKNMFAPDSLTDDLLVLVNAIYFKGQWEKPFDPTRTVTQDFHVNANHVKKVNMMTVFDYFNFNDYTDLQASVLELPYSGSHISMFVLLPINKDGLAAVAEKLTGSTISDLLGQMHPTRISVSLPKFKLETTYDLKNTLPNLGITDLFTDRADLSGLSENSILISQAVHKAIIEVDEEGTVAAGTTGLVGSFFSAIDTFNADHPFVVAIVDKRSSVILFSGLVVDP